MTFKDIFTACVQNLFREHHPVQTALVVDDSKRVKDYRNRFNRFFRKIYFIPPMSGEQLHIFTNMNKIAYTSTWFIAY